MLQMRTDAEAIAASRLDPERFGEVFDRHFGSIHRYAHRRVGRHLADDIAAETFTQAFRQRDRYDGSPDARPWLFGIASNLLRRHHRGERRQLFAYARTGVDRVAHTDLDDADARMDAEARSPQIALALVSLRSEDREVVLLLAWAELTYEEIARALGIPVGTVRSRLHRGRKRLRDVLDASGGSPDDQDAEGETR
ncbi:MAG: RNA polymerase sigma factor [Actinomycetota bacterium]